MARQQFVSKFKDVRMLVYFSYQSGSVEGAAGGVYEPDYVYQLANQNVTAFDIRVERERTEESGRSRWTFSYAPNKDNRGRDYFDEKRFTYALKPNHGLDVDELLNGANDKNTRISVDLVVRYPVYSETLLSYVARTDTDDGEYHNLANPLPKDRATDEAKNKYFELTHTSDFGPKHKVTMKPKYIQVDRSVRNIAAELRDFKVSNQGRTPLVEVWMFLKVKDLPDKQRDDVTRVLLATDHGQIIEFATDQNSSLKLPDKSVIETWPQPFDLFDNRKALDDAMKTTGDTHGFDISADGLDLDDIDPVTREPKVKRIERYLLERPSASKERTGLRIWKKNVLTYFVNYVNLERGSLIRQKIANAVIDLAETHAYLSLAIEARNLVDKYLITSNHWNGNRERYRPKSNRPEDQIETHQHILADAFGQITVQAGWGGSPVYYCRRVPWAPQFMVKPSASAIVWDEHMRLYWLRTYGRPWTLMERADFVLQVGAGHCGEHAMVCFAVLMYAMELSPKVADRLKSVVWAGNRNTDHAFCVIRLRPEALSSDKNAPNVDWKLWDIGKIPQNEAPLGAIIDPYLSPGQQAQHVGDMLRQIRRKDKTDFIRVWGWYPDDPEPRKGPPA